MKSNVDKALKDISVLQRKQVPFAAALGLTNTAKKVMKVEQRMMVKQLDRPTPFTVRGIRIGAHAREIKSWVAWTPVLMLCLSRLSI